jgi:hypothetical protein
VRLSHLTLDVCLLPQGAAQGLSEVLSGLGMERLNSSSPRHYVREGFISLLVYLPTTFGHRFVPHLGRIIPPILGGLADESEYGALDSPRGRFAA